MMGRRILLIDDDELLNDVLADFLELSGYDVVQAGNGRIGLERLADSAPFDIIVLDLLMPEMDGVRFLNALSETGRTPPPVLVLSASATANVVESLDFPCVVGIVRKPIQPPALLDRLSAHLDKG